MDSELIKFLANNYCKPGSASFKVIARSDSLVDADKQVGRIMN